MNCTTSLRLTSNDFISKVERSRKEKNRSGNLAVGRNEVDAALVEPVVRIDDNRLAVELVQNGAQSAAVPIYECASSQFSISSTIKNSHFHIHFHFQFNSVSSEVMKLHISHTISNSSAVIALASQVAQSRVLNVLLGGNHTEPKHHSKFDTT